MRALERIQRLPKGLTLLESLLTVFLVGLTLVIISDLTTSLRKSSGVSSKKARYFEAMGSVLNTIRAEIQEAVEITVPLSGNTADRLESKRFLPEHIVAGPNPARLEWPLPSPRYGWDPKDSAYLGTAGLSINNSMLTQTRVDGTTLPLIEARSIDFEHTASGMFKIQVEIASEDSGPDPKLNFVVTRW